MSKINDGGPAFPLTIKNQGPRAVQEFYGRMVNPGENFSYMGMTLRDFFAGLAMQGLLAAQIHGFNDRPANGPFASMAYEMADAMLKAREGE